MKSYRADIDGLRSIAVLPVLFFHAGLAGFGGGFVGVDVFFVISGFLITGIIARGVDEGRFSILRFYERRFRRLLPALVVVLVVTTLLAWPVLSPDQLGSHGKQLVSTSFFSSNIYFWRTTDYFGPSAEDQLLLHTWSLAVEEQFYFVFPPVLLLLARWPGARKRLLWMVAIFSFGISEYGSRFHPDITFYLLPTRAWELLAGGLLSVGVMPSTSRTVREVLGWVGMLLIAGSVLFLNSDHRFPGAMALPAVVGTMAVLYAGMSGTTSVGTLLATPILVAVGKFSYSLYLWHWPLLLLSSKYIDGGLPPSGLSQGVGLLVSFPLAYASWRWVENPMRYGAATRSRVFTGAAMVSLVGGAIGLLLTTANSTLSPWSPAARRFSEVQKPPKSCFGMDKQTTECRVGAKTDVPVVAIWGDSHAHALLPGFQAVAAKEGWSGRTFFKSACAPLVGVDRVGGSGACMSHNDRVLQAIVEDQGIQIVVLSSRWSLTATGERPEDPGAFVHLSYRERPELDANQEIFAEGLHGTVEALTRAGKRVVLVGPTPEFPWHIPHAFGLRTWLGMPLPHFARSSFDTRNQFVFSELEKVSAADEVALILLSNQLCGDKTCVAQTEGRPLYSDGHHLSLYGSTGYAATALNGKVVGEY